MIVRRTVAEVNAVLAGVTLVASFAIFKASIAIFNGSEERTPSRPFGRWVFVVMVETGDSQCSV
jgi:hypothetical protein